MWCIRYACKINLPPWSQPCDLFPVGIVSYLRGYQWEELRSCWGQWKLIGFGGWPSWLSVPGNGNYGKKYQTCETYRQLDMHRYFKSGSLRKFVYYLTGWWFQMFIILTPTWGNEPIWLIFFKWVETTNQLRFVSPNVQSLNHQTSVISI